MSDSEVDGPSEATISRALQDVVIAIHKTGSTDDLTVKRVRARAEEKLGLPGGYLKKDEWKQRSHSVIHEAVDKYCVDEPAPEPIPTPPPKKAAKPKAKPAPQKKSKAAADSARGVKRKAPPAKKAQKRRKTASSEDESEAALSDAPNTNAEPSDAESEPPTKPARRQTKVVTEDSEEEDEPKAHVTGKEDETDQERETGPAVNPPSPQLKQTPPPEAAGNASDSDLSSLIDESPVKKKRQKKAPTVKGGKERKAKEPKTTKSKAKLTKTKAEDDPDQAEIKRLQGWLVKCGIRKVWGKELAKCDTSKEKIRHLRGMLQDAGMEGKYSNEKAARIKEQREFAKDLEDIQAGALAWGKTEEASTARPRRRVAQKPVVPNEKDDEDEEGAKDDEEDSGDDDQEDEVKEDSEDDGDGGDASE